MKTGFQMQSRENKAIYFVVGLFLLMIVGILTGIGTVFAVPEPDPKHAFAFSEIVMVGKILSVEIISEPQVTKSENSYSETSGIAIYKVQIEEYLKNPSGADTVMVTGYFLREPHPMAYETYPYDVDQRVLLYLSKNHDTNTDTDLIIGTANSRVVDNGLCDLGSYFEKGLCVIVDDSTITPNPSCKSGPRPDGEGWVFVNCNWEQYANVPVNGCERGNAPANNYAWNSQDCLWEWSPLRNENATGPPEFEEPEPPTISDEQQEMMREYCQTGIRHPDMIGIPQCIKNELVCGPNSELAGKICVVIDGRCEPDIDGNTIWCDPQYDYLKIILSESSVFLFVFGILSLIAGTIICIVIWRKRK